MAVDRFDIIGALVCFVGMAVIMYSLRGADLADAGVFRNLNVRGGQDDARASAVRGLPVPVGAPAGVTAASALAPTLAPPTGAFLAALGDLWLSCPGKRLPLSGRMGTSGHSFLASSW
ncbi:YnfA family protein [Streptomyces brevispora]|uniref:hypothetical protein n=1 Tax=Streptomyces brevispora TaxID=887462 RepID=UPI00382D59BD